MPTDTTHAAQIEAFRAERAAWWADEARKCDALDMHDLAFKCRVTAEDWRRGGPLAEMLERVA